MGSPFLTNREEFESTNLGEPVRTGGKFRESSSEGEQALDVVVPYCTVGFRSGQYAKKLVDWGCVKVALSAGFPFRILVAGTD